jgi:hypothetical protein
LWGDLQIVLRHSLPLVNFATEPVRAQEVAERSFGIAFDNATERPPAAYDMRSKFARLFGSSDQYFYSAEQTFDQIRRFAARRRGVQAA